MKNQSNSYVPTGSVEEMEAWLDELEKAELDEASTDSGDQDQEDTLKTDNAENVDITTDSAPVDADESELNTEGVMSADGKHVIPFDVLQKSRTRAQELEQQNLLHQQRINELEANQSGFDKSQRILELRNKQLTNLGVAPEDLPEDIVMSDEEMEQLSEDYPELARPMRAMAAKIAAMEARTAPQDRQPHQNSPAPVDVNQIIASIPDLEIMRQENGDDWRAAIALDDQLMKDPEWQGRSQVDRFREVTRQVSDAKNSTAHERAAIAAKAAIEKARGSLPNSPSEIGSTNSHQQSKSEFVATANAQEMQDKFMAMELDEMETYL